MKRNNETMTTTMSLLLPVMGVLILLAVIRWIVFPWLLTPTLEQRVLTAKIALFAFCALPLVFGLGVGLGKITGSEKGRREGEEEAWEHASSQIAMVSDQAPQRADDFLAGAKKGLGIVADMTKVRAQARVRQPLPAAQPQLTLPAIELIEAGSEVIDA